MLSQTESPRTYHPSNKHMRSIMVRSPRHHPAYKPVVVNNTPSFRIDQSVWIRLAPASLPGRLRHLIDMNDQYTNVYPFLIKALCGHRPLSLEFHAETVFKVQPPALDGI